MSLGRSTVVERDDISCLGRLGLYELALDMERMSAGMALGAISHVED